MDKAPNYPNSQNVSPQGMQRCLAWYPQQFRALRTPGLTGLKASLGWAPGEVSTWPHNTMLDYGPLERKQAQGNGQNKSGARDKIKVVPGLPRGLGIISKEAGTWKTCRHPSFHLPPPVIAILSAALTPTEGPLLFHSFHLASSSKLEGGETPREF